MNRIHSGSFRNVSWGVHLNLSEGKPVSTGTSLLTGPDGSFLGKVSSQPLLMRQGDKDLESQIAQEIDAQIALLETSGIPLSHLDGHQHVHVFPAVLRAMLGAAHGHHIRWIRIPNEPEPTPPNVVIPSSLREEARLFSGLGQRARSMILEPGLYAADHFRGLYLKGHLSIQKLESVFRWLPDGLTELMVHPGRISGISTETPFSSFSTAEREQELETLRNAKLRLILHGMDIVLTPFPEKPC